MSAAESHKNYNLEVKNNTQLNTVKVKQQQSSTVTWITLDSC